MVMQEQTALNVAEYNILKAGKGVGILQWDILDYKG